MTLNNTEKQFIILYFIIVMFELITGSTETLKIVHHIAKPAIVISLMFLFYKEANNLTKSIKSLTLAALVFSLLGDILLMFVEKSPHFFTAGLVAFLLAHIMYVLVFFKHKGLSKSVFGFVFLLLVYAAWLFYLLKAGLGELLIPVIIYMIVILTMATAAYMRKSKVNKLSFTLVFVGAIFFMISDSILALNKFHQPIPLSNVSIMVTYAIAQFSIVLGILKIPLRPLQMDDPSH